MILIGNKCDLIDRKVKSWELEEKADDKNCKSFETSAKENINVNEAFDYLAEQIITKGQKNNNGFFTLGINDKGNKRVSCLSCNKQ
jgi:GTPase SAR1 family protein